VLRYHTLFRLVPPAAVAGLLALVAGCGSSQATVQGKVTSKGQTVHAGTVSFHDGATRRDAAITQDGTFTMVDVAPGEYKVTVEPSHLVFRPAPAGAGPKAVIPGLPKAAAPPPPVPVDPRYKSPTTTDVTVAVHGGRQTIDVELR
jgi:hypothetical protein